MQAIRVHSSRAVDELVLLDVAANMQDRTISPALVRKVSETLRIPFTVGGGISAPSDVATLLAAGADKVVVGTAAFKKVGLVSELSSIFGSQAIVCSVDSVSPASNGMAISSGKELIAVSPESYALRLEREGAGELLLQSIAHDGELNGMDFNLLRRISEGVAIPIIFNSGASGPEDFYRGYSAGASAVCAGALFQFTDVTPETIREYLAGRGVLVRKPF